ncbi:hypothetical protein ALC57_04378 [Trachymyrmex cornetzi]|uniref:Uncharacterized protein n=1 Tax=Trachymyrmex cornetzi TaxID=471704 RepID=A0A151JCC6_9HYME|nr:hypothetical protein ALC57_04378 [Trachymyrmex cornetzi]
MAQPLQNNTPSFCLSIFGTDNRFTASDVLKRWIKMQSMAKEFGITILGHSSDGDTRLMKAMKTTYKLPASVENKWPWFHCMKPNSNALVCQDTIHIGTKLRTRLLHEKVNLQIGNYIINKKHLEYLILNFGKDKHLLTISDINGEDKMNYRAVEKICDPIVTNILNEKVANAKGSVIYLKAIRNILDSFLNKNLAHRERLFLIWKSVFIFRIWRNWILEQNDLILSKNFITSNSYMSVEINAHFLLMLFQIILSDSNLNSSMCVPWLMSSQPCEQIFRSTRSLTSTFSTIVNFSLNDIMNRIKKIQIIYIYTKRQK